ncbi:type I-F CRISPR-associated protein Csy1 [Aeromonas caviae]|uniref:Type I-F CRISPR-associated protein Csy1 n=1 Tax=Aeromonas caviae TaxID=648 RepID=A0A6S4TL76_AERCA|nr:MULTISPECIES: type I-F CRISPR-associated protein Csy1 [Aeromonas]AXV35302.1 type I-F CRISPR-associated protein Csy1 [Aeromonas hydrophila]MBL0462231.1 type I-F CRISPR-associated protein Csy1 [Aeromonas dhakensis]MCR3947998.1 type I-F CRISPR-associated protein Csy1 [Aeromonas caviae]MCX4071606.1 type I-F CRISPR-associated protein Csy1 [Aeromonas caviae]MDF2276003.1 type I-F CRISPR-associated protein Csy1 [Aeromonas caviae]
MGVEQLSSAIDDYISARLEAKPDKWPSKGDWLDDAAKRAKQITLVTHAPKFTHGDARGIGARVEGQEGEGFLSTASLTTPAIDVIGNAAALDVANLLLLEADGKRLVDQIQDGDASSLAVFTKDKVQLETWCDGLSQALVGSTLTTHTLAKQTYFPVDEGYHLLSPLFASSLCHALYQRIEQARFGDEAKAAREARRKNECSDLSVVDFPHLAEQHFGGTKPQNVSLLNSKRYGRAYLLSCQPPTWQDRLTAPENQEHFWKRYEHRVAATLGELNRFLKSVEQADNNDAIKQRRADLVDDLVGALLNYGAELRTLPSGWSRAMAEPLNEAFCRWLDPIDSQALSDEEANQIALAFGRRLNQRLQKRLTHVGDAELHVWRRLLARQLRLLKQDLEEWA